MKIRLVRSLYDGKWVPFQQLSCDNDRIDHPQSPSNLQLAIPPPAVAAAIGSYSRFKLPNDGSWIVKKVLRRDGSSSDKYYYEAGTGKKFRSLKEVERYINGEEHPVRRLCSYSQHQRPQSGYSNCIIRGGKVVRLDEEEYDQNHSSIVKYSACERTSITDLADGQLVPFQQLSCDSDHIDHHSPSDWQLAISSLETGSYSGFKVPDDGDWIVKEVPRRDGSRTDKYYYEAGTGMKFRSSKEVERYIKGREYRLCSDSQSQVVRLDEEEFNQNHPSIVKSSAWERKSITDLPDGWVIEKVPRRLGGSDRYYYEPGTGRKFRSLVAVFRHLEEEMPVTAYIEEMKESAPPSKAFKLCHQGKEVFKLQMHWQQKGPRKRSRTGNGQASSFVSRPKKVGWVLCSSEGDDWYPIICGQPAPDSVKQQWYQRYMGKMTDNI